jgi:hypothetical protein
MGCSLSMPVCLSVSLSAVARALMRGPPAPSRVSRLGRLLTCAALPHPDASILMQARKTSFWRLTCAALPHPGKRRTVTHKRWSQRCASV